MQQGSALMPLLALCYLTGKTVAQFNIFLTDVHMQTPYISISLFHWKICVFWWYLDDLFAIQLSAEDAQHFTKSVNCEIDAQASISLLSSEQEYNIRITETGK